MIYYYYYYNY